MTVKKSLYRTKQKGKIAGVCAGIAEYLGWEIWLVRILALTGFILIAPPFFFVAYIAGWFILEDKSSIAFGASHSSRSSVNDLHTGKGWKNESTGEDKKVEIKNKVWQAGEPPAKAFVDIKKQFHGIEQRLRNVESYVTSSEFQLKRQIDQL